MVEIKLNVVELKLDCLIDEMRFLKLHTIAFPSAGRAGAGIQKQRTNGEKTMAMKGKDRMIRFVRRLQIITIFCVLMAFTLVSMPILFSQSLRRAYLLLIDRQIGKVVPPRFVFAGDRHCTVVPDSHAGKERFCSLKVK